MTGTSFAPSAMQKNHSSAHAGFAEIYATSNPPWDIGRPKEPFMEIADQVTSPVLDAGCGTGDTALFFAARGLRVTGIDFVEEAIQCARIKAANSDLSVKFLVRDAMSLVDWDERFATVIDSGLFHIFHGDSRQRNVQGLEHVIKPGERLLLFSFTDDEASAPGGGVSQKELYEAFSEGWDIESVKFVRGELNPKFVAEFPNEYPNCGPKMFFAIVRRKE